MGHKIGLNGVDNGFMMFDHYFVPKTCLLNKLGDVLPDGTYQTPFKYAELPFAFSNMAVNSILFKGIQANDSEPHLAPCPLGELASSIWQTQT